LPITYEFAFWVMLFIVGVGLILLDRYVLRPYWCDNKADKFKVWSAFLDIEEQIKKENYQNIKFPGVETKWIAEKVGFSEGKTLGALNELAKEGKVHHLYPRWYSGSGGTRGMQ